MMIIIQEERHDGLEQLCHLFGIILEDPATPGTDDQVDAINDALSKELDPN